MQHNDDDRFREQVRRLRQRVAGNTPEAIAEREELHQRAEAQRRAWGYGPLEPPPPPLRYVPGETVH